MKGAIKNLFWFDVETTGLKPTVHEIVQLSYIMERVELASGKRGDVLAERNLFLRALHPELADPKALEKNKLTLAQIAEFPPPEEAFKQIRQDRYALKLAPYGDQRHILAGYNVDFDRGFIEETMNVKLNKKYDPFHAHFRYAPFLCVMQNSFSNYIADAIKTNAYPDVDDMKLKSMVGLFIPKADLEKVSFHNALDDIRVTRDIWYRVNGL